MLKKAFLMPLLLMFYLSSAAAESVMEITLVEDPWPPYITGETGLPASGGTLIELYKEVFKLIKGVKVNYHLMPWKRALIEVENGKHDGIMALFKTPERLETMDFTAPIFTGRTMLWYSSEKFPGGLKWDTLEDLTPYNIIMERGSAMGKPLVDAKKNGVKLTLTEVNSHEQQFEMIGLGRGDITVLTEIVGYHLIHKSGMNKAIVPMEKPLSADDIFYMAFSKKSPARKLIPQIDAVIETMKKTGQADRILRGEAGEQNRSVLVSTP
jgi:polar amino acid transport system substrate-binding protein